ncbi:MAG: alkaline shock response membrane anchor protein AmaP [Clostridiales bacterium]|nr:alkaline shock response membrane anchor protein AmaP [Clostridiales bacterium]
MKIIEKIALAIFVVLTWIAGLTFICGFFNIIPVEDITSAVEFMFIHAEYKIIFLVIAIICIVLDVVLISYDDKKRKPIITESEKGILEIMPETIENIALIEVGKYASVQDITTRMKMKKEGIIVNVYCKVLPEVNICDLTRQLQDKIKERIEKQTGNTVKCVNIHVKDVKKPKETKTEKED